LVIRRFRLSGIAKRRNASGSMGPIEAGLF